MVPGLWQRELGTCQQRTDATAHCKHQRSTYHRGVSAMARSSAWETLRIMERYKAWADELTYSTVMGLPDGEASKQRPTRFGNMVHTLNHLFVVDDIFRHHLEGRRHSCLARNTGDTPLIGVLPPCLREKKRNVKRWAASTAAFSQRDRWRLDRPSRLQTDAAAPCSGRRIYLDPGQAPRASR